MARAKKDGERISLFLDRELLNRIRADADNKGQTLTAAIERAIKAYLQLQDDKTENV